MCTNINELHALEHWPTQTQMLWQVSLTTMANSMKSMKIVKFMFFMELGKAKDF